MGQLEAIDGDNQFITQDQFTKLIQEIFEKKDHDESSESDGKEEAK